MSVSNTLKLSVLVVAGAFAGTAAFAHGVVSETVTLPVTSPGASTTVTVHCPPHHWVTSGGYEAGDRIAPNGPMEVTASYPATTRSWAVEFTNRSGRPTGVSEATATVSALCGSHPWHP